MMINKEQLLEDLRDTASNDFDSEVVDYLLDKYAIKTTDDEPFLYADAFQDACYELLELICHFIDNAE